MVPSPRSGEAECTISPLTGEATTPSPSDPTVISRSPASTGPDQTIGSGPVLRIDEPLQRRRPEDTAAALGHGDEFGVGGDHENELAGHHRHVDAADLLLPQPRPLRRSMPTMRPLWLTATTMSSAMTGSARMSASPARAPKRRTAARLSDQAGRPVSMRSANSSPEL